MTETIDPNTLSQLQTILAGYGALNTQFSAVLTSQSGGGGGGGPSPAGSTITGPTTDVLTDANGDVWGLGAVAGYGYLILKNGALYANGSGVKLTIDATGVIWTRNAVDVWYMNNGTGWSQQSSGPV